MNKSLKFFPSRGDNTAMGSGCVYVCVSFPGLLLILAGCQKVDLKFHAVE